VVGQISGLLEQFAAKGVRYQLNATLDFYWRDVYRPELFWRSFVPMTAYNKDSEAIYIFKRAGT
jgi:hypothetical protein